MLTFNGITCADVVNKPMGAGTIITEICEAAATIVDASRDISRSMRGASLWGENGKSMDGISISLEMHAFSMADTELLMISAKVRKVERVGERDILSVSLSVIHVNIHFLTLIRYQSAWPFPQDYK